MIIKDVIKEGESYTIEIEIYDEDGVYVFPSELKYRLDDVETGNNIIPATVLDPGNITQVASKVIALIPIPATASALNSEVLNSERHVLTAKATYDTDRVIYGELNITVENVEYEL